MSTARINRFLASTALAATLAALSTGAIAEPKSGMNADAVSVPATPAPSSQPTPAAPPADRASEAAPPAAAMKSEQAAEQPASVILAPAVAVAPSKSNSGSQSAKAGGDEVPTTGTVDAPSTSTSAEPAPSAAAPATVSEIDAAVTDQLRELANGKFDRLLGGKRERAAYESFYAGRNFAPLWIADGKANARALAAIAYIGQVDADGLDPADYPVPNFSALTDPAALAEGELKLAMAVATYAHHAEVGRVHWTRVSGDIFYDQKAPSPTEVLGNLAQAKDVGEALAAYEPHHPAYLALKAKLADIRTGKAVTSQVSIANGPVLKAGMQDDRVPQLRERLHLRGDSTTYDKALAEAVSKFQQDHDIKPTGTLTSATVEALNGRQPERPADIIIANMERWRWMPHDLGKTYVIVNLPDFTLRVIQNGRQAWMTKIVDGKPALPTPIMSAEMKYITVNPTWNVPPSIIAKEYMPILQQDSSALERMGLQVTTNPDGTVHIAQPPGERNALGRLRFNFPNKFLVYQHDTPEKHLFAYEKRAFSHGCMRVQDPVRYAEVLLSIVRPHDGYTQDRIRGMFSNNEVDIQFPTYLPVHLTYQTAFVDADGKLEFRDDVYGRDKALISILKSDERKVADIPIERKENTVKRELLSMPVSEGFFGGGRGGGGGGNFFQQLFGGGAAQPAQGQSNSRKRSAQAQ